MPFVTAQLRSSILDPRSSLHRRAFTMIEVVLVLVVLAVVIATAAPALRGWSQGSKLHDAARQVMAAAQFARSQAASTATPYRLQVDPNGASFALGVLDDAEQQYVPAAGEWGQATPVPQGFRIELTGGSAEAIGAIDCYPDGRTTPATLRVVSPKGDTIELGSAYPAEPLRQLNASR